MNSVGPICIHLVCIHLARCPHLPCGPVKTDAHSMADLNVWYGAHHQWFNSVHHTVLMKARKCILIHLERLSIAAVETKRLRSKFGQSDEALLQPCCSYGLDCMSSFTVWKHLLLLTWGEQSISSKTLGSCTSKASFAAFAPIVPRVCFLFCKHI